MTGVKSSRIAQSALPVAISAMLKVVIAPAIALLLCLAGSQLPAQEPTGLQAAAALEDLMVKAIAQAERSVVAIARVKHEERRANIAPNVFGGVQGPESARPGDLDFIPNDYATGVVIGNGLILTANHVLAEDSDYWITTAGRKPYRVERIVGADPRIDLAVLQIEASDLVPIKFGDGSKLKKGQIVIALGNPFAIARDGQASASWGIISNLSRKDAPVSAQRDEPAALSKPALHHYGTLIQTDARLNLGTSGGALINLKGEMIGLTMALSAVLGHEQSAGFALPVDETFRRAVETLKQGREVEFGFLGVSPRRLSVAERAGGKQGVNITVVDGTPAQRAGLQSGDRVVRIGDQEIHDLDDLMLSVGKLAPDEGVKITVYRGEEPHVVPVHELAKFASTGRKIITNRPPAWRGMRVDYVTASPDFSNIWIQQHRFDPQGSVLITEVEENSPAWKEGLRANMTVTHVGGHRVATPRQFRDEVAGKSGPLKLRLHVLMGERVDHPERVIPPDES